MRIPMQVYFDAETIEFYKEYARQQGKSFAELMRNILNERKTTIAKSLINSKRNNDFKKNITNKEQIINNNPIMQAFVKAKKSLKNIEYHFENLTDDELLYKYAR
jgi:hypothetical protein